MNLHRSRSGIGLRADCGSRAGAQEMRVTNMNTPATSDLTRTFLVILIIAILIVGSVWTMLAFLAALLWAGTLVITTWPVLLRVQRMVGGSRGIATTAMTLLMNAMRTDVHGAVLVPHAENACTYPPSVDQLG